MGETVAIKQKRKNKNEKQTEKDIQKLYSGV